MPALGSCQGPSYGAGLVEPIQGRKLARGSSARPVPGTRQRGRRAGASPAAAAGCPPSSQQRKGGLLQCAGWSSLWPAVDILPPPPRFSSGPPPHLPGSLSLGVLAKGGPEVPPWSPPVFSREPETEAARQTEIPGLAFPRSPRRRLLGSPPPSLPSPPSLPPRRLEPSQGIRGEGSGAALSHRLRGGGGAALAGVPLPGLGSPRAQQQERPLGPQPGRSRPGRLSQRSEAGEGRGRGRRPDGRARPSPARRPGAPFPPHPSLSILLFKRPPAPQLAASRSPWAGTYPPSLWGPPLGLGVICSPQGPRTA